MRPFLPPAALLAGALLLACQEQASGPVGPDGLDPVFRHNVDHVRPCRTNAHLFFNGEAFTSAPVCHQGVVAAIDELVNSPVTQFRVDLICANPDGVEVAIIATFTQHISNPALLSNQRLKDMFLDALCP